MESTESTALWGDSFWVNGPMSMYHESYATDAEWEEFRDWVRIDLPDGAFIPTH